MIFRWLSTSGECRVSFPSTLKVPEIAESTEKRCLFAWVIGAGRGLLTVLPRDVGKHELGRSLANEPAGVLISPKSSHGGDIELGAWVSVAAQVIALDNKAIRGLAVGRTGGSKLGAI